MLAIDWVLIEGKLIMQKFTNILQWSNVGGVQDDCMFTCSICARHFPLTALIRIAGVRCQIEESSLPGSVFGSMVLYLRAPCGHVNSMSMVGAVSYGRSSVKEKSLRPIEVQE